MDPTKVETTCSKCRAVLTDENAYRYRAGGYHRYCKKCACELSGDRYRANPEKAKAAVRAYHAANPEKSKRYRLKKTYGLTLDQFSQMQADQNGCCAICEQKFSVTPCVDHDHETGKVRALLCPSCNLAFGHAEKGEWLEKALAYRKKFKCR